MRTSRTSHAFLAAMLLTVLVVAEAQSNQPPDGALYVTSSNAVVNQYAVLAADANAGATSISVTNISDLDSATRGALAAHDLVLIIQMQGATIDTANSASYGNVVALNHSGRYEIMSVTGVQENRIGLTSSCGGLKFSYTAAGKAQVIRIPQFSTLDVTVEGTVTALPWDGARGGVVAVKAQSVTVEGAIDASGAGFRGGAFHNTSAAPASSPVFRSTDPTAGADKGESIAGYEETYITGRYGRGAPANGGGGGGSYGAGGGGGANASNLSGAPWDGNGVMNGMATGAAAWLLDPAYTSNGNALTVSPGGGRGGYSYSSTNMNALTVAPGNIGWGGDNRRNVSGLGGHPLDSDPSGRIFFGGGGGAGDSHNSSGGAGGRGGGIVVIVADMILGSGMVRANGSAGEDTVGLGNGGAGGGGAGGTILVSAATIGNTAFAATGGSGGSQLISGNEAEGPGGGGGGGFLYVSSGVSLPVNVSGGSAGTTTSQSLTEFPVNGATDGNSGIRQTAPASLPTCVENTPPIADAGKDQVVFTDVKLDASGSHDPDGTIVSYQWNLQHRGNTINSRTAEGVSPTVSTLAAGFYDVTLTVTDNNQAIGTDQMTLAVTGICDISGDGKMGLEEVIFILQVLSGARDSH